MIICCGWNEKNVMAIPTAAAAAHSPARACRVLPRSVPNPGGRLPLLIVFVYRVLHTASRRLPMKCDDIYHRATPQSSYYFKKTGLVPEFGFFFCFFLAGSPTWLLKAAWTKTRTDSIYLYNIIYSRVRLVCFSSTPSLPTSQFHNTHSLFFFLFFFFHKAPVLCFQHFIVSIFLYYY